MENYFLSLKNLYRLLTVNDYPVYSVGVIPEKNKKGLTLNRFWSRCLLYSWRNTARGRLIWRTDGRRTHYQSEFLNRKKNFPFYELYLEELLLLASREELRRQISAFSDILEEKQYAHSIFLRKVSRFLELAHAQDPCVQGEVFWYLEAQVASAFANTLGLPDSWWAGYLMTLLSLYAAAGEAMAGNRLRKFIGSGSMNPEYLADRTVLRENRRALAGSPPDAEVRLPVELLTLDNSELRRESLVRDRFFGREKELYDLKELLTLGGKYLISGIGGVGKTELLRQLLAWCVRTQMADRVAAVQYEENLACSFARSFRSLSGASVEECFYESIYRLEEHPEKKTVLFLDNLDHSVSEDPFLEELGSLSCTVFVSSRRRELKGFTAFEVREPDARACALIFRDNYKTVLSDEEKEQLLVLTEQENWRHPLTLCLLGRAAYAKKWSFKELAGFFVGQEPQGFWREQASLDSVYQRLYSTAQLSASQYRLVRMFALLPYRSIRRGFVRAFFSGFFMPDAVPEEELGQLALLGWLEETGEGYRMHPVIAECLRTKPPLEEEFVPFWRCVEKCVDPVWVPVMERDAWRVEAFELAFYAACRVKGIVSARFLLLMADMGLYLLEHFGKNDYVVGNVRRLAEMCRESTEELQTVLATVCLFRVFGIEIPEELPEYESLMKEQERHRTISRERFCLLALLMGYTVGMTGRYERAQELLREGLALAKGKPMKLYLAFTLGVVFKMQMRDREAVVYFERCLLLASGDDRICRAALMDILYNEGMSLARLDRLREGEQCLQQIELLYRERAEEKLAYHSWTLQLREELAVKKGDRETALECARELVRYVERYHGQRSYSYLAASERLGLACHRMSRYEEALEHHLRALALCRELFPEDRSSLLLILNNTGMTCVDAGRIKDADVYLAEAYALSCGMSDTMRGESAWQMARFYRKTGRTREEMRYLREAQECFLRGYEPGHSKTEKVRERLGELACISPCNEKITI